MTNAECPEPQGNEGHPLLEEGMTQHAGMLKLTGECPWCGARETTTTQYRIHFKDPSRAPQLHAEDGPVDRIIIRIALLSEDPTISHIDLLEDHWAVGADPGDIANE